MENEKSDIYEFIKNWIEPWELPGLFKDDLKMNSIEFYEKFDKRRLSPRELAVIYARLEQMFEDLKQVLNKPDENRNGQG